MYKYIKYFLILTNQLLMITMKLICLYIIITINQHCILSLFDVCIGENVTRAFQHHNQHLSLSPSQIHKIPFHKFVYEI